MLVLTRKTQQSITIGDEIKVTITNIRRNNVSLAIDAPQDFKILRTELKTKPGPVSKPDPEDGQ